MEIDNNFSEKLRNNFKINKKNDVFNNYKKKHDLRSTGKR